MNVHCDTATVDSSIGPDLKIRKRRKHFLPPHEFHEAARRKSVGVCIGDDKFCDNNNDDGAASNWRSETVARPHASSSVAVAESFAKTGSTRTD
jgi:hypothetical protein